jgi:hypothetical protein
MLGDFDIKVNIMAIYCLRRKEHRKYFFMNYICILLNAFRVYKGWLIFYSDDLFQLFTNNFLPSSFLPSPFSSTTMASIIMIITFYYFRSDE